MHEGPRSGEFATSAALVARNYDWPLGYRQLLETRPTIQLATSLQFFSWGLGAPSSEKVLFFRASPSVEPDQQVPGGDLLIASLAGDAGLVLGAAVAPTALFAARLIEACLDLAHQLLERRVDGA